MRTVLIFVWLLAAGVAFSATYSVSTTGSDDNDGSSGSPWRTFAHAFDVLVAGDILEIQGGTYTEPLIPKLKNLESSGPIIIRNVANETVILDGRNRIATLVHLPDSVNFHHIRGLEIINATGAALKLTHVHGNNISQCVIHDNDIGVLAQSCNHIVLDGNTVFDNSFRGIHFTRCNDDTLQNNTVYQSKGGILCDETCRRNLLINNTVYGCPEELISGSSGIMVGKQNILYRNKVYENDGNGIILHQGNNNQLIRNAVFQNGKNGILIRGSSSVFSSGSHSVLVNNTVCDNDGRGIRGEGETHEEEGRNVTLYNNIVAGNALEQLYLTTWFTQELAEDYNDWYPGTSGGLIFYDNVAYSNVRTFQDSARQDTHSVSLDPLFADAAAGDYQLTAGSPLVDAGTDTASTFIDAALQFAGSGIDLGAYELNMETYTELSIESGMRKTGLPKRASVPLESPFVQDPKIVSAIPAGATDWVLLQLLDDETRVPFRSISLFLAGDGRLLMEDGHSYAIPVDLIFAGDYYLRVERASENLVIHSARPVAFDFGQTVSYRFSESGGDLFETAVKSAGRFPENFMLYPNTPNPFNLQTEIAFALSQRASVRLTLFNVRGQKVREMSLGPVEPGRHAFIWDGTDDNRRILSSGVYFLRLESGGIEQKGKCVLLK